VAGFVLNQVPTTCARLGRSESVFPELSRSFAREYFRVDITGLAQSRSAILVAKAILIDRRPANDKALDALGNWASST
jgi:hypothetical protein